MTQEIETCNRILAKLGKLEKWMGTLPGSTWPDTHKPSLAWWFAWYPVWLHDTKHWTWLTRVAYTNDWGFNVFQTTYFSAAYTIAGRLSGQFE